MTDKSIGFIGGGRVTRILLGAFHRAGQVPPQIVVSDMDDGVSRRLKESFPAITSSVNDNAKSAKQDLVFLALHPPAIRLRPERGRQHPPFF